MTNAGLVVDPILIAQGYRPLNISGFKKSASSSIGFNAGASATADPGADAGTTTRQNQNQNSSQARGGGGAVLLARSKSSGGKSSTAPRIYAPRPFTPSPPAAVMTPQGSAPFSAPEFKTPSLPFAANKSVTEEAAAAQARPSGLSSRTSSSSARHQSFFGGAHEPFSFDDAGGGNNNLDDDSGYYSSVSGQNENDENEGGGQLAAPQTNRNQNRNGAAAVRRPPSVVNNEVPPGQQAARGGPDFEANFSNLTKRIRPASPGDCEDLVQVGARPRESELSKRPCVRPSHSPLPRSSHGPHSRSPVTHFGNAPPGETQTASLPHNVPHPTATIQGFPGLEFSEDDLGRYAELYEKGAQRWSRSTMEEWLAGANDIMVKFSEMMDMVSPNLTVVCACVCHVPMSFLASIFIDQGTHEVRAQLQCSHPFLHANCKPYFVCSLGVVSSKVNLYKSLHTKLADEHSSLDQRATELRGASQALVRDSGNIGGGLDSSNLDMLIY